jgi:xanthosine phosphorylase
VTEGVTEVGRAAAAIRAAAPGFVPRVGLVLGSGLGPLAERIEPVAILPYGEIPEFPHAGAAGHAGRLVLGQLAGIAVACFQGRVHAYEGQGVAAMAVPIRALKRLGAELLLLTNAAGSLSPGLAPGQLMSIADHINFLAGNPLTGPNDETTGPRFPSLADCYDPDLRRQLRDAAASLGLSLAEGVYLATQGPNFETPAEIRAFRMLGADAVGMSTVPEAILARHCGLRVAALSVITNFGEGMGGAPLSHAQTLAAATGAASDLELLLVRFLESLPT